MFTPEFLAGCSIALLGVAVTIMLGAWLARRVRTLSPQLRAALLGAAALCEIVFWASLYAYYVGPNLLVVRQVSVVSAHWRGAPIRIAVLGDIGLTGTHMSAARIEDIVARVDALHPDLVVLLGNYVSGPSAQTRTERDREEIARGFTAYALLNARLGVVAVLGDQDALYGEDAIARGLEDGGVAALSNRNLIVTQRGVAVAIAGVKPAGGDLMQALDGAFPLDIIAFAHSEAVFEHAPPGLALMLSACSTACGQREVQGATLYATPGLGGRAFRLLHPPEIALITLSSGAAMQPPAPT